MDPLKPTEAMLPLSLVDEIEAVAASEQRSAREVLRDAMDRYLQHKRSLADANMPHFTPAQAADRIRERRQKFPLPKGMSIRDLLTFGRA